MAYPFRHLIVFAALPTLLPAQILQSALTPIHFSVFGAQPVQGLAFVPRSGLAAEKLAFFPATRSPRYEYRGPMPLRFVEGPAAAVVAEATVPPDIHDALLLFAPMQPTVGSARKYRVAVVDDGAAGHAPGGLVVINFSGLALSGTIDGKKVTLDDGLNPARSIGRSAKIVLKATVKGRTFQSYADDVRLKPTERALLILFPPFNPGSIEVQSRLLIDEPPVGTGPSAGK